MQSRSILTAILGSLLCLLAVPVQGKDLLDYVIEAIDPTLAPARPLIECLAGGGSAEQCALEAGKTQAAGVLPIGPGDDRVQKAAKVFAAARDERWLDVLKIGGEVVAKSVSCAVLPLQGPVKGTACSIIGWVISKNAGTLDKVWQALKGPDWWALVDVLGPGVCSLIPGDGAAGLARDMLCGTLGAVLAEAKKWASTFAKGLSAAWDAVEDFFGGDDGPKRMSADQYFAFSWQPWYHYSTASVLRGQGLGSAIEGAGGVYERCVDYYSVGGSTICGLLKQKFSQHVQGFAGALPVAVDGYFATVARPAIRAAALSTYGKPATGGPPPGQELFVQNCAFSLRQRVPFPEPNEGRCVLLQDAAGKHAGKSGLVGALGAQYGKMAASCFKDVKLQDVQPTVWVSACEALRPRYQQAMASEALWMIGALGRLKGRGCITPDKEAAKQSGLMVTCPEHAAYSACLGEFQPNGKKYCKVAPIQMASSQAQSPAVAAGPVAPPAGGGSRLPVRVPAFPTLMNVEAEERPAAGAVTVTAGRAGVQAMAQFGAGWSGDAQLLWGGGAPRATLTMTVDAPAAGEYALEIYTTRAPDYGDVQVSVNGQAVNSILSGYTPSVVAPIPRQGGRFALRAGPNTVSFLIVGKQAASTGYLVGIDRLRFYPMGR